MIVIACSSAYLLSCMRLPMEPAEETASVNLALNKPVVVSSTEGAAYPGEQAVDGDTLTVWSSDDDSYRQSIYVDLGETYAIDKVVVRWADGFFASVYDILVSSDANNWSTIFTNPDNTNPAVTVDDSLSGVGRYVQILGRGRGGGTRYRIAELEIYGVPEQPTTPEQQVVVDTITNRLMRDLLHTTVDEGAVSDFIGSMNTDGSWDDVDYDIVTSELPANVHLNRLIAMAIAYKKPGNSHYQSTDVLGKVVAGLDFYREKRPESTNWWYNDIGGPQNYMVSLLLIKHDIPRADRLNLSSYLLDQTARFAGGGRNLTWIANITMYKGCIEDSYRLVDLAFAAIASPLEIVTVQGDEGIKSDFSFHQHHAQIYSGGYGMTILSDFTGAVALAAGTPLLQAFSAQRLQLLNDLMLQGHQLFGYRHTFDFGTRGRDISRQGASRHLNVPEAVLDQMIAGAPAYASAYMAWKEHLTGAPFPVAYQGNTYFWKSDIMTQHGPNHYLSAKVISQRTYGTEALNGENTKGFNLPLGATNILTHGDEYHDIYPIWDWTRIPGTTAEHNQQATILDGYQIGTNEWGGGVSNGRDGAIAFNGRYNDVQTRKAYFFLNGNLFCVGSGIVANKANPILTSVNQCFQQGVITANRGNNQTIIVGGSQQFTDLNWVHHDRVGYLFPAGGAVTVQGQQQTGSWRSIHVSGSTASITDDVFSVWFDHGNQPNNDKYAYLVVPDKELEEFAALSQQHGYVLFKNETGQQAVGHVPSQLYAAAFYHSGSVDIGEGWTITSNGAALLLLKKNGNSIEISLGDPLYNQDGRRRITINKALSGPGATTVDGNTEINFEFPTGDETGKSVTQIYTLQN